MASNLSPAFAYTVVYVKDVAKSVVFYAKAFGFTVRRLDQSHRWVAFTPLHQRETDELTGLVHPVSLERQPVDVCFAYQYVDAAYKLLNQRAVEHGATPLSLPENKSWGQRVGYVRDIGGIIVRMESCMNPVPTSTA